MTKDQFIVEALGECWHEWKSYLYPKRQFICQKCRVRKEFKSELKMQLDTPEGFFWLWERFQKHERNEEFFKWQWSLGCFNKWAAGGSRRKKPKNNRSVLYRF